MEVADIYMDKESDCVVTYSNGVSHDTNNNTMSITEDSNENIKDCEVKECTTENLIEINGLSLVEEHKVQDTVLAEHEARSPEIYEAPKIKKYDATKSAAKSSGGNAKTKHTVPQPFALATEKRALYGARPAGLEIDVASTPVSKPAHAKNLHNSAVKKRDEFATPSVARKPLQPDNKKRPDEDDSCSVASSTAMSVRSNMKSRFTSASAPVFRCTSRAERRKEFYSKLEEKHQALEAEKSQSEARTKEEKEAAMKQLRKSLTFKANPMPSFYHEAPPPKVELKRAPPTRAKSPKLGRRNSSSDTNHVDKRVGASARGTRQSIGIYKDNTSPITKTKKGNNVICKIKDETEKPINEQDISKQEIAAGFTIQS